MGIGLPGTQMKEERSCSQQSEILTPTKNKETISPINHLVLFQQPM